MLVGLNIERVVRSGHKAAMYICEKGVGRFIVFIMQWYELSHACLYVYPRVYVI